MHRQRSNSNRQRWSQAGTIARALVCLASLISVSGCGGGLGKVMPRLPFAAGTQSHLPRSGAAPGLVRVGRVRYHRGSDMAKYLGANAQLYINYHALSLFAADYYLSRPAQSLTIEIFNMDGEVAAAGLFHYFRGRKLRNAGKPVPVGAQGVLDARHERRNLYFYKQRYFVKLIYSGAKPVPDLVPLAQVVTRGIPGSDRKPEGFRYLEVEGVKTGTAHVTPGYTFNCDFLPPAITAKAPGAGSVVADVYLIVHNDDDEAQRTARDYRQFLQLNGKNFDLERRRSQRRLVWRARDPSQGRVICTVYKRFVIIVARPHTYDEGGRLLDRIVERIRVESRRRG